MENFSLLTISGPRLPSCAMKSVRDLPPPSGTPSRPACVPCDVQSGEPLGHNYTIYRPWFSPYSYFVCTHKAGPPEPCSLPEMLAASARDAGRHDELPESVCSSSCSLEQARPPEGARKASPGAEARDCITSQDILLAAQQQPAPRNGYKCAACCRVFPTLHSLKTHVKCGSKEGFSCQVYYYRLKALWAKEGPAWPSDWPPSPAAACPREQSRPADVQPPGVATRGQRGAPRTLRPNPNKADN